MDDDTMDDGFGAVLEQRREFDRHAVALLNAIRANEEMLADAEVQAFVWGAMSREGRPELLIESVDPWAEPSIRAVRAAARQLGIRITRQ